MFIICVSKFVFVFVPFPFPFSLFPSFLQDQRRVNYSDGNSRGDYDYPIITRQYYEAPVHQPIYQPYYTTPMSYPIQQPHYNELSDDCHNAIQYYHPTLSVCNEREKMEHDQKNSKPQRLSKRNRSYESGQIYPKITNPDN